MKFKCHIEHKFVHKELDNHTLELSDYQYTFSELKTDINYNHLVRLVLYMYNFRHEIYTPVQILSATDWIDVITIDLENNSLLLFRFADYIFEYNTKTNTILIHNTILEL